MIINIMILIKKNIIFQKERVTHKNFKFFSYFIQVSFSFKSISNFILIHFKSNFKFETYKFHLVSNLKPFEIE